MPITHPGGQAISEDLGIKLENVTLAMLGKAKKVMIEKENTTIVNGTGKKADIEARVAQSRARSPSMQAANSALCKALSGSAGCQLGLARNGWVRKKTCPAASAERLHDVDCFLSQVADLHSGQSATAEFINGQTR